MTKADLAKLAFELPIEEQLDLAQEIWDHASPPDPYGPSELEELLERRRQEALANPEACVSWDEVKARLPETCRDDQVLDRGRGPVALWDGIPRRTSADHDTIYDEP